MKYNLAQLQREIQTEWDIVYIALPIALKTLNGKIDSVTTTENYLKIKLKMDLNLPIKSEISCKFIILSRPMLPVSETNNIDEEDFSDDEESRHYHLRFFLNT